MPCQGSNIFVSKASTIAVANAIQSRISSLPISASRRNRLIGVIVEAAFGEPETEMLVGRMVTDVQTASRFES